MSSIADAEGDGWILCVTNKSLIKSNEVNEQEKAFMLMWNQMTSNSSNASKGAFKTVMNFVMQNKMDLMYSGLVEDLIKHVMSMYALKVLTEEEYRNAMHDILIIFSNH